MATAPKSAPKVVPIDEGAPSPAPNKSKKKKLVVMLVAVLLALAAGGGAAWYFLGNKPSGDAEAQAKHEPPKPPVFLQMEQFTVNLQPEVGEQYLQIAFTLQVANQEQVELIKLYMPLVRSRLLMLLSSKKASELSTPDGKKKLQDEIIAAIKQPFAPNMEPQGVNGVFFTSFVIQ
jgi:flagellar FliL protein